MFESIIELSYLRILLAVTMLGIASYIDITKREINDFLWIFFGGIAVVLVFLEPAFEEALWQIGFSLIIAPFVLIIWRLGMFGGADAFALIVLAGLAPQISFSDNIVTPLSTLTNAILLSITPLFFNLVRNLAQIAKGRDIFEGFNESMQKRIFAIFLGYKAKNPKYCFSIERKVGKHKKLDLSFHHAEYTEFCQTPNTWVTPGVPYILFITAGFIIQLLYGDMIFNFFGLTI